MKGLRCVWTCEEQSSVVVSSLDQVVRSTHLPPLPLPVVALEQALVIWNSILAIDEARRRRSVSDCSC